MTVTGLLALAGACCATPVQARVSPRAHSEPKVHVSPQDAAATRAYLQADYAYEQAAVANLPASRTALEDLADRIAGECPGILKRAPAAFRPPHEESGSQPSARRSAELSREEGQAQTLQEELALALGLAYSQPDRQAASTFVAAVEPLSWGDPRVASLVHQGTAEFQERVGQAPPDVCGDMRAWVASGYRTLSLASKEFRARQEQLSRIASVPIGARHSPPPPTLAQLLARYENAADRRLIANSERLAKSKLAQLRPLATIEERLLRALGISPPRDMQRIEEESNSQGVVIARGRTAAGEPFVAKVRRNASHSRGSRETHCQLSLSIESTQRLRGGSNFAGSEETCLFRSDQPSRPPSVNCNSGRLTITLETLPAARSVRLRMSDGRTITSPVIFVPSRLGGPAGYYYQVVRGPSPIPVALAELNAHGRTLRTIALPHIVECAVHPLKYLPGGIRTLVQETVPNGGPPFTITAERYRFLGKVYFELKLNVETFSESGSEVLGETRLASQPEALEWRIEKGCKPHPYAILYAVLKKPGEMVLSRTGTTLTPWRTVPIPVYLHAGGALVYTVLNEPPEEIIVRAPDGHTIASEKLAPLATEARETCEGEAEG